MEIYIKIFEVIFPVFFVIGVGYYLGKKNPKFDTNFITNFAGNIGTPAMIFYTVTTAGITLDIFIHYFIYAIIMIAGFAIIGLLLLFFLNKDLTPNFSIRIMIFSSLFFTPLSESMISFDNFLAHFFSHRK